MKVRELKQLIEELSDEMDIFIDDGQEELFTGARIDNITESCEDLTVVGYVLVGERTFTNENTERVPKQLKPPFDDDPGETR
jgi:hypothetical protein